MLQGTENAAQKCYFPVPFSFQSFFEKPTFSISPLLFLWYNFSIIHIIIERRYHEFFLLTKEAFLRCPADDRRKHCQAADSICASTPCRKSVSAALQHCWQYCCGQLCQQDFSLVYPLVQALLSPTILEAAMTKHFIAPYIPQSHWHLCLLSSLRLQDYFCHHFFFV